MEPLSETRAQLMARNGNWLRHGTRSVLLANPLLFMRQLADADFSMPSKKDTMAVLRVLLEQGKITPVVDRTFPLGEVPEAIRYLKSGHVQAKVVNNRIEVAEAWLSIDQR